MNMAEYVTEIRNTLFKINRQSWTELKMLENHFGTPKKAGQEEQEILDKAKQALSLVTEILEKI